ELSRQMTTSTTSIDIMGLQAAYANLHTDQERDYFMQRYHDVISSFGGKTSYDADNRPLLVMRSNLWASGYDVDGTDQTRFVIVSIFIPKLRLILILNSFLGSSDSLVFSELFHSLAPRPLAA